MNEFINCTKNQHYISRAEQRSNAINSNAAAQNKKNYSFSEFDRENYKFTLDNKNGVNIANNLSFDDLFTYEKVDKYFRSNLESLFQEYENDLIKQTNSLIEKLQKNNKEVIGELFYILVAKFINFIRNPLSIKKVINTFSEITNHRPTDSYLNNELNKILQGEMLNKKHLLESFGVSDAEYRQWLGIIFMNLVRFPGSAHNVIESTLKSMLENKGYYTTVCINYYNNEYCILSDRSYAVVPENAIEIYYFQLTKHAFLGFISVDYKAYSLSKNANHDCIMQTMSSLKSLSKDLKIHFMENNLQMLKAYNKHTSYQCHSKIFCASKRCYGLNIMTSQLSGCS